MNVKFFFRKFWTIILFLFLLFGNKGDMSGTVTAFATETVEAGEVSVTLKNGTKTLTLSEIDIAHPENAGAAYDSASGNISFDYRIAINSLKDAYFNDYISPYTNNSRWTNTTAATNFTITFPAGLFDTDLLEIDWSKVTHPSTSPCMILQKTADGIILQGNTSAVNSGTYISSLYFGNFIYITVPVTLKAEKFEAAKEKGEIALGNGTVVTVRNKNGTDIPDWIFSARDSIKVIDSSDTGVKGELDITSGTETEPPEFDQVNKIWTLKSGSYSIMNKENSNEGIQITGDVTLSLDGVTIDHSGQNETDATPVISVESDSKLTLHLENENSLSGASGWSAIYVAENAELIIQGNGTLTAKGGDGVYSDKCGGAAGIGGNGVLSDANGMAYGVTPSFGTITIKGGTITAIGGNAGGPSYNAGAGIGAGGTSYDKGNTFSGTVNIEGGTITAIGGDGLGARTMYTGGGAGIGSGGVNGSLNYDLYPKNEIKIFISGGEVTATGKADGAGIGGGNNADGGVIVITGGTVTAIGGYEEENTKSDATYGGAGIGGGDNGSVTSVEISGNAKVTATAGGAAAGIGSGSAYNTSMIPAPLRIVSKITITGNADVTAYGGSGVYTPSNLVFGGAAIGTGYSRIYGDGLGTIEITGNAKVRAYAGKKAQAIGAGSYKQINNMLQLEGYFHVGEASRDKNGQNGIDVWMFNQDTVQSAFWGQTENGEGLVKGDEGTDTGARYKTDGANAVWYTTSGEMPDASNLMNTFSDRGDFQWKVIKADNDTVQIVMNDVVRHEESSSTFIRQLGNWGTFYRAPGDLTISKGMTPDTNTSIGTLDKESKFTFTLSLADSTKPSEPLIGAFRYTIYNGNDSEVQTGHLLSEAVKANHMHGSEETDFIDIDCDRNGKWQFKLKTDQYIKIFNLEEGTKYDFAVTEEATTGYDPRINGKPTQEVSGEVSTDNGVEVDFVNLKKTPCSVTIASLTATKKVEGNGAPALAANQYSFIITPDADNDTTDPISKTTVSNYANGMISLFNNAEYVKAGTYKYTVQEIVPTNSISGMSYDTTIRYVTVEITEVYENGEYQASLQAEVYVSAVTNNKGNKITESNGSYNIGNFINTYTAESDPGPSTNPSPGSSANPDSETSTNPNPGSNTNPDPGIDSDHSPSEPLDNMPLTNDNNHLGVWITLLVLSALGILGIVFFLRKK